MHPKPLHFATSLLLLLLTAGLHGFGQNLPNDVPASLLLMPDSSVTFAQLPPVDNTALCDTAPRDQFALPIATNFLPGQDGEWAVKGGIHIWRMGITSPGAFSLNALIRIEGEASNWKLFAYNQTGSTILGPFTAADFTSNSLNLAPIAGEQLIIELNCLSQPATPPIRIAQIAHDFRNFYKLSVPGLRAIGEAAVCQVDVACDPLTGPEKNAICLMVINGSLYCTANLINNTSQNSDPFLLTAYHCVKTPSDAANTVFYFGFEKQECGNNTKTEGKTLYGARFVAGDEPLDFTLLRLNQAIPRSFQPYYAGWNRSATIGRGVSNIHHPAGDVKKITRDYDAPITGTFLEHTGKYHQDGFWHIEEWEQGVTEGGSSGSGLFDSGGRLIGTLTGGNSYCSRPYNDYFSKLRVAWDHYSLPEKSLSGWLDPLQSGATLLEGLDPYASYNQTCDTLLHALPYSQSADLWVAPFQGCAEQFKNNYESVEISGFYISVKSRELAKSSDHITCKIWKGTLAPEEVVAEKTVYLSALNGGTQYYVDFGETFTLEGDYFLGFETTGLGASNFKTTYVPSPSASQGQAMTLKDGVWLPLRQQLPNQTPVSFMISSIICGPKTLLPAGDAFNKLTPYPNPTREGLLWLGIPEGELLEKVSCYNREGEEVAVRVVRLEGNTGIEMLSGKKGLFILKIKTQKKEYTQRWMRTH